MQSRIRAAVFGLSLLALGGAARAETTSLFVDNAVGAAATPFSGGTMAGTTNYSF